MSARDVDHFGQCTLFELIGLANIEDHHVAGSNFVGGSRSVDLGDLRLGGREQIAKRCHGQNATCEVGFSA